MKYPHETQDWTQSDKYVLAESLIADGRAKRLNVHAPQHASREQHDQDEIRLTAWKIYRDPFYEAEKRYRNGVLNAR